MALSDALLNIGADAMADAATHVALHDTPDGTGSGEVSTARVAAGWGPASGSGDVAITSPLPFTGTPEAAFTHAGLWSAAEDGVFYGSVPLTGDLAFNAAGQATLTTLTLDGTATD